MRRRWSAAEFDARKAPHAPLVRSLLWDHVPKLQARLRGEQIGAAHAEVRASLRAKLAAERTVRPMLPQTLMETVASVIPANVAVVEEAVTTTEHLLERLGAVRDEAAERAFDGTANAGVAVWRHPRPEAP